MVLEALNSPEHKEVDSEVVNFSNFGEPGASAASATGGNPQFLTVPPVADAHGSPKIHNLSEKVAETSLFGIPHSMLCGNETLLLVEDEEAVRAFTCQALKMCGYAVLEASNGEEACQIAGGHQGPLHLVVSDVVMPHLGGFALAVRLRIQHPGLKVLFMSGYSLETVLQQGVWEPEFAFLQKPASIQTLAMKVRAILDEK